MDQLKYKKFMAASALYLAGVDYIFVTRFIITSITITNISHN